MHSTALIKPEAPVNPEKLIDEALRKMAWYMAYTEQQLARVRENEREFGATDTARRRIQAYKSIKSELAGIQIG